MQVQSYSDVLLKAMGNLILRARPGVCQFRQRAIGVHAASGLGEGGAGGCAAQVEIVEGGTQFEQRGALAAREIAAPAMSALAGVGVGVGVGAQP